MCNSLTGMDYGLLDYASHTYPIEDLIKCLLFLWQNANKTLRELRERKLCIWSDIWTLSWKINKGSQVTNSGAKDISYRENNMYDQRPENGKTLDITRQCVFGCRGSQRECERRFWTGGRGGLGRMAFMLRAGLHQHLPWHPRASWEHGWHFGKCSKDWVQPWVYHICAFTCLKFSFFTHGHLR